MRSHLSQLRVGDRPTRLARKVPFAAILKMSDCQQLLTRARAAENPFGRLDTQRCEANFPGEKNRAIEHRGRAETRQPTLHIALRSITMTGISLTAITGPSFPLFTTRNSRCAF